MAVFQNNAGKTINPFCLCIVLCCCIRGAGVDGFEIECACLGKIILVDRARLSGVFWELWLNVNGLVLLSLGLVSGLCLFLLRLLVSILSKLAYSRK